MITADRARKIADRFPSCRIAVLGDLILDRYVWGSVDRISPEAPVPVVRVDRESVMLGGAGNVARNLASLGARTALLAVAGDDEASVELRQLCGGWKIECTGVITDASRPTTIKTRVIARAQQVVRYDRETEKPIGPTSVDALLDVLRSQAADLDGMIIEDYGKGLLTPEMVQEAMSILAQHDVRVFVDPKKGDWEAYRGAELVKPNLREAEERIGIRVHGDADLESLGRDLLTLTGAATVVITRGEGGMSFFSGGEEVQHIPTRARAVSDVAGAGDTTIATLALARLSGASWLESVELANAAAGYVVGVPGTATLSPDQLLGLFGVGT